MDVRTGDPLWPARPQVPLPLASLTEDLSCDVVVLGGGVTGALTAFRLVEDGRAVVLLDRDDIGHGSTAASTGLLQYEVDVPLDELIKKVGTDRAVHAYRRGQSAVDEIEGLLATLRDDCGFERRSTLCFASHWWHAARLRRQFECLKSHGFDVQLLSRNDLRDTTTIKSRSALRSNGDGHIDPLRFTRLLVKHALQNGLRAYVRTTADEVRETRDGVIITAGRFQVRSKKIVYATGYEAGKYLDRPLANLNSTYAVASQPNLQVNGWPDECLLWETARPYFYARRTEDGRAIIGGGDTSFRDDHESEGLIKSKSERLVKRFHALFPDSKFELEFAWAGTFAETKDGLAYIGQLPDRPTSYFAMGYGGNGITFSVIAARLIADLYAGRSNPDAAVFSFER